jgi:hypothetical protein
VGVGGGVGSPHCVWHLPREGYEDLCVPFLAPLHFAVPGQHMCGVSPKPKGDSLDLAVQHEYCV